MNHAEHAILAAELLRDCVKAAEDRKLSDAVNIASSLMLETTKLYTALRAQQQEQK